MHSLPNFAVLEGVLRHKSSAKQQQSAMLVSDILEKLSLLPRSAHQSPLSVNHQIFTSFEPRSAHQSPLPVNHQIFTSFEQRRSFPSYCCHLNVKQAFKVKDLVPMTMHHCRCHWSRPLYQVFVRTLMQKRPLLTVYNSLTHCRIPVI